MTEPFRDAPPSKHPEGSEPFVFELVAFADRYGALHPDTYAGAECKYVGERPRCVASFTGDLSRHRAALDPRIHVAGARRTGAEYQRIRREASAWILAAPGVELDGFVKNDREDRLAVLIEAEDFEASERALTERFGEAIQVERVRWTEQSKAFEEWAADGATLTVHWIGGADERPHRLEVEEEETSVTARVISLRRLGPGKIGDAYMAVAAVGVSMELSIELKRPLGARRVIDGFDGGTRSELVPLVLDEDDDDWMLDEPKHPTRDLNADEMRASWHAAEETSKQARPYLRAHRSEIAAEWFEQFPWGVWFCVAFGPGARKHRPHLDPSINVRRSDHSRSALEQLQRDLADFVARTPHCSWSTCEVRYWDAAEREVLVTATAPEPEAFTELVEERFGENVSVHLYSAPTHDPTPTPFVEYRVDDEIQLLGVRREADGGPAFLLLHETDEAVLVTVIESRAVDRPGDRIIVDDWDDYELGPEPAAPSVWVAAELKRPLGGRAVIDATTGEARPQAAGPSE